MVGQLLDGNTAEWVLKSFRFGREFFANAHSFILMTLGTIGGTGPYQLMVFSIRDRNNTGRCLRSLRRRRPHVFSQRIVRW